jgi:hypothetical protein
VGIERDIFHLLRLPSRLTPPSVSLTHTVNVRARRRSAFMPSKLRPAGKWLICQLWSGENPKLMISLSFGGAISPSPEASNAAYGPESLPSSELAASQGRVTVR